MTGGTVTANAINGTLTVNGALGTFAGLPDGACLAKPGAQVFQITYTGGNGNDVVLTRVNVPDQVITSSSAVPFTGQVAISATVAGTPGLTYVLEMSTDLTAWSPVVLQNSRPLGRAVLQQYSPAVPAAALPARPPAIACSGGRNVF